MDENKNKTGVWIQNCNGIQKECQFEFTLNPGDLIEIYTNSKNVRMGIAGFSFSSKGRTGYSLVPLFELSDSGKIVCALECLEFPEMRFDELLGIVFTRDIQKYIECPFDSASDMKVVIIPKIISKDIDEKIFGKNKEHDRKVMPFGEPTTEKTHPLQTMNEDLEIQTCTIPADKIKVDTFNISNPEPTTELGQMLKQIVDRMGNMGNITIADLEENHIKFKEKEMYTEKLKDKIKKVIYVDKEMTVKEPVLDGNGKQLEEDGKPVTKDKLYRGMVKVVWNCGSETVAYTSMYDRFNKEEGFKTCVLKYLFGNAGAHDAVDFWTNKYVKYPSSCVEITENLCKLEKILENDKQREEERKGLPHAKFLRRSLENIMPSFSDDKLHYSPQDEKLANEFKKLAKKYFPELKGKEIYINNNKQNEVFVAIK